MKKIFVISCGLFFSLFFIASCALASSDLPAKPMDGITGALADTGINTSDSLPTYAGILIKTLLGLLGLVFILLIIYAGFLWMTSQGDDTKVTKAKGLIINSMIGLVIILCSYIIADFIITTINLN